MSNVEAIMEEKNISQTDSSTDAGFGARGWLLIIVGWLCFYMSASAVNDSLNVTIPLFQQLYGWNDGMISRVATYSGWVGAFMVIPAALVMAKVGAKRMLLFAEFLMTICVFNLGQIRTFPLYAANYMLITFSANVIGIVAFGTLASHWFPKKKGQIMGWSTVGCNLGSCTCVWFLSASFRAFPTVNLYFIPYAAIPAAAFVLTLLFLKDYPEQCGCYPDNDQNMTPEMAREIYEEGQRYKASSPWTYRKLLKTKQTWLIIIGLGMYQLCTMGVVSHIVPILMARGYDNTQAMLGMTAAGIVAIPCSIGLGIIDDKFGTKKAAILLGTVSAVLFLLVALPYKVTAVIAAIEGGIMMGCSNNLLVSLVTTVYGRYDFDKAIGIIDPLYMTVGSAGIGIVGTIGDTGGITAIMILLAVLCGVAIVLLNILDTTCIGRAENT